MARTVRARTGVVTASLLVSSCYIATHYEAWRYRGGPIRVHTLLSRPRFEAPFPSLPFNVPGTYEYTFSRFPADDAGVMLIPSDGMPEEAFKRLTTTVRLRVSDQNGGVLCEATAAPASTGEHELVVTSSPQFVIGLYFLPCVRVDLRACAPCRMSLAILAVDPATPAIRLTPTLQGGGIELP